MQLHEIYASTEASVCSLDKNILKDLEQSNQRAFKQMMIFLRVTCENGLMRNETKFKKLDDNVYEFKPEGIRVLCFIIPDVKPRLIILSHFFAKPKNKLYKAEISRTKRLAEEVIEEFKNKKIEIIK